MAWTNVSPTPSTLHPQSLSYHAAYILSLSYFADLKKLPFVHHKRDSYHDFLMFCKIYTQGEVGVPVTSWVPEEREGGRRGREEREGGRKGGSEEGRKGGGEDG